jgi:hypothetical protein
MTDQNEPNQKNKKQKKKIHNLNPQISDDFVPSWALCQKDRQPFHRTKGLPVAVFSKLILFAVVRKINEFYVSSTLSCSRDSLGEGGGMNRKRFFE